MRLANYNGLVGAPYRAAEDSVAIKTGSRVKYYGYPFSYQAENAGIRLML